MLDTGTLTLVITGVSGVVTAIIPFAAKWSANRSEAVKAAASSRDEDVQLMKDLLLKCRNEKLELIKLITASPATMGKQQHETT